MCDKQEKDRLIQEDSKEIEKFEKNLQQKYEIKFKNRYSNKNCDTNVNNQSLELTVIKNDKWYIKIFDFFRKLFNKNNK